jgi:hypothetical protein
MKLRASRFLIAVSTFAIALSAGRPTPAQACSCVNACKSEPDCIKESFKYSAAVFVGTPIEVDVQPREFKFGNRTVQSVNYHIRFAVKESFKGTAASYAVSDNGSGGGDCSYGKMDKGRDYLIYAESISGGSALFIHACSRTEPLDAGLGTRPSADSDWSEDTKKSMLAGQKALRKELVLLRKLRKHAPPAMP